jgi:hypothetical protein
VDSESADKQREPLQRVFPAAIIRFTEAIAAIRGYIESVEKHFARENAALIRDNALALIILEYFSFERASKNPTLPEKQRTTLRAACEKVQKDFAGAVTFDEKDRTVTIHSKDQRIAASIERVDSLRKEQSRKVTMFREGALVAALGFVEVLAAHLIRLSYELHPGKLDDSGSFTYAELCNLGGIEDAKNHLVDKKVSDSMYGGVTKWLADLKRSYDLKAPYCKDLDEVLSELSTRRNLIVHNDGKANDEYAALWNKMNPAVSIKSGERIRTTSEYLIQKVDLLETTFTLIGFDIWVRTAKSSAANEIANQLVMRAYEALKSGRWSIAMAFSKFVVIDPPKELEERVRIYAQLNLWQAMKWSGEFDAIKNEVNALDWRAYNVKVQLAWFALADDAAEFFKLLNRALASGEIEPWEARDWPIFREMRKDSRFATALKDNGIQFTPTEHLKTTELAELLSAASRIQKAQPELEGSTPVIETKAPDASGS